MTRAWLPSLFSCPSHPGLCFFAQNHLTLLCTTGTASSLHDRATRASSSHAALPLWLSLSAGTFTNMPSEAQGDWVPQGPIYLFQFLFNPLKIEFVVLIFQFPHCAVFNKIFQKPAAAFPLVTVLGFDGITRRIFKHTNRLMLPLPRRTLDKGLCRSSLFLWLFPKPLQVLPAISWSEIQTPEWYLVLGTVLLPQPFPSPSCPEVSCLSLHHFLQWEVLSCPALTFAERVPGCPIGDAISKVVPAVPAPVHPAVGVRVGFGQLEGEQPEVTAPALLGWRTCPALHKTCSLLC